MNIRRITLLVLAAAALVFSSCEKDNPDDKKPNDKTPVTPKPPQTGTADPYADLGAYQVLKSYVDRDACPSFRLGVAIDDENLYNLAGDNFDEMTAGNAMKYASVVDRDGMMNFNGVVRFLNAAESRGLTVYGHTLAWHSQQQPAYLNSLIQDKYVEQPGEPSEIVLVESGFDDGGNPFIGWGNSMSMSVSDGTLKVTNPSVMQYWEVQFAYDVAQAFVKDQEYTLSFRIKGSAAGALSAGFQILDGYKSAGEFPDVQFGTDWETVGITCQCIAAGATRLVFSIGTFAGDIYIDDFRFSTIGKQSNVVAMTPEEKKAALTAEMERWIKGMMEVTATRVSTWDVVNEAIAGQDYDHDGYYDLQKGQPGDMTNFFWQDYMGSIDYVRVAVASARKYYAECGGTKPLLLFINDYNLESDWDDNKKLRSLIHWIEKWEADGVTKIDGIGTQMHISYYENPTTQANKEKHIVQMLQLMAATGKLVKISELDMGYVNNQGQTLNTSELTERQHRNMAEFYRFIVSKYLEIVPPAQQYGITQWCPTDSQANSGWRAGEPTGLWDLNYNRKPAYVGYVLGLTGK